jgi:Domain of unknown function (DUF1843)
MVTTSYPGGFIPLYGVAIGNAIASPTSSVDELLALRSQAQAIVEGHGDLASAVVALDKEIASRGGPASATGTPPDRFVVQIDGLKIPSDAKLKIESAINDAVKSTLARHDVGTVTSTPLSQIKSFGAGLGGATAGMVAHIQKKI